MKHKLYSSFISICIILLSTSCIDETINLEDINQIEINNSLAVPLGSFSTTTEKLIESYNDTVVIRDTLNNRIYVHWENKPMNIEYNLFQSIQSSESALQSGNYALKNNPSIQPLLAISGGQSTAIPNGTNINFEETMEVNSQFNTTDTRFRLDSVDLVSMVMQLVINTTNFNIPSSNPATLTFTFPDYPNVAPIQELVSGNSYSSSPTIQSMMIKFDPINPNIKVKINFDFTSDGSTTVDNTSAIDYSTQLKNIDIKVLYGEILDNSILPKETVTMDIPTDFFDFYEGLNAKLYFSNPEFKFQVNSNIGLPLDIIVSDISATDKLGHSVFAEFGSSQSTTVRVPKPQTIGAESSVSTVFNRNNGGTHKLFQINPKTLTYNWEVTTYTETPNTADFLFNPQHLNIETQIDIPFQLDPPSLFNIKDTIEADIYKALQLDETKGDYISKKLRIYFDFNNALPIALSANVVFTDENYETIYTNTQLTIKSGQVDTQGSVKANTKSQAVIIIDEANAEKVMHAKYIILNMEVSGYDSNSKIKLNLTDSLQGKVSAFVNGSYIRTIND